jgi:hypothetical protein
MNNEDFNCKTCALCEQLIASEDRYDYNTCVSCAKKEMAPAFKALIQSAKEFKSLMIIDNTGTVWGFAKWYGSPHPHFRCNMGHWSESILDPLRAHGKTFQPYKPEQEPTEQDQAWHDFYTRPLKPSDSE